MARLKSMKLTKAERKDRNMAAPSILNADEGPAYPWGLTIDLEEESIKKLGLASTPKAGETLMLEARVKVSRVAASDSVDQGETRSLSLQITDLCLEPEAGDGSVADRLYKGKK